MVVLHQHRHWAETRIRIKGLFFDNVYLYHQAWRTVGRWYLYSQPSRTSTTQSIYILIWLSLAQKEKTPIQTPTQTRYESKSISIL
jgi:hypothetical protein